MARAEDNQNTQKENIVSFQEISFRLYQPEEVESMGHHDLVALFLEHQEQLREAVSILAEQDWMVTCLLEFPRNCLHMCWTRGSRWQSLTTGCRCGWKETTFI